MPDHEAWEMNPRKLTPDEIEHPEQVIEEFFQYAQLPQVRWIMWEGIKTLVTGSFIHLKPRERASLIYFYEQMEKLIEVVHVMHGKKVNCP
ncbi:MAG: hypothetical protein H0X41_07880 [Chitinophagaceae bacterium]|nr:hypothetical protein [Chitinophagaceae bacterium]